MQVDFYWRDGNEEKEATYFIDDWNRLVESLGPATDPETILDFAKAHEVDQRLFNDNEEFVFYVDMANQRFQIDQFHTFYKEWDFEDLELEDVYDAMDKVLSGRILKNTKVSRDGNKFIIQCKSDVNDGRFDGFRKSGNVYTRKLDRKNVLPVFRLIAGSQEKKGVNLYLQNLTKEEQVQLSNYLNQTYGYSWFVGKNRYTRDHVNGNVKLLENQMITFQPNDTLAQFYFDGFREDLYECLNITGFVWDILKDSLKA